MQSTANSQPAPRRKEFTLRALLLGVLLALVLGAANAYLGLFAGMTVSGSVPAAVMSMAVLALLAKAGARPATIQENNLVQTAASAGEALVAGMIFTLPALFIIGYWQQADYSTALMILALGGVLGVMFAVPLRRALVLDQALRYPEGRATAAILKTGHNVVDDVDQPNAMPTSLSGLPVASSSVSSSINSKHASKDANKHASKPLFQRLLVGAAIGALVKLASKGMALFPSKITAGVSVGSAPVGLAVAPASSLIGVGYILGIRIALVVGLGGLLAWLVIVPLAASLDASVALNSDQSAWEQAESIWASKVKYVGVGAMLVGGLWALAQLARPVLQALRSMGDATLGAQDIPARYLLPMLMLTIVPLFLLYQTVLDSTVFALPMTVLMLVLGFVFCAVAAWMTGTVGSSSNPVSGMTIATIMLTSLLLLWLTGTDAVSAATAIMVGGVVCTAAAISGDTMQDLAAGHHVGATPWMQQVLQFAGVLSAALVMPLVLMVLHAGYGFAGEANPASADPLAAPQATAMAAVVEGVLGDGKLPWFYIALGALLAVPIGIADEVLRRKDLPRLPILAVAVGAYLPLHLITTIMLGGLLAGLTGGTTQRGTLFAAGLITGEALLGIGLAVPVAISADPQFLPFLQGPSWLWLALAVLGILCVCMWWFGRDNTSQ